MSSTAAPAAAGGGGSCGGGGESYVAMRAAKAAKQQAHHAQQQQHVGGLPGARRGGLTDHIAGPHLIPNVGREAMVAAQVVCRRHRPPPKKPAEPPAPKGKTGGGGGSSTAGAKEKKRRRNPSEPRPEARGGSRERRSSMSPRRSADRSKARSTRSRSRSRIQSRSASPQRSLSSDTVRKPPPPPPKEKPPEPAPPRDEPALTAAEVRKREVKDLQEYREAEKRRAEEEKRKLQELEQARQKARELQESRKKKLGGAFALEGQDDEEEDPAEREKVARELARTTRKVGTRPPETQGAAGDSGAAMLPYAQSVSSALVPQGAPAASEGVKVAATDIDGRLHDHKFSRVWKDWDASKRDDPGEVARQFMKIAAIKRRGVDPRSSRRRSRSRS